MTPEHIKEINESFYKVHKAIPLTKGMMAFIDDEDYELVVKYKWHFAKILGHGIGYAVRAYYYAPKKKVTVTMHQDLMNYSYNEECDHIDGNGLNNHRSNLRVCTHAENLRNQAINKNNKFGVAGVCLHSCGRFYLTRIMVDKKVIHLGTFRTLEEAKNARYAAEIKYFGEFRRKQVENIS